MVTRKHVPVSKVVTLAVLSILIFTSLPQQTLGEVEQAQQSKAVRLLQSGMVFYDNACENITSAVLEFGDEKVAQRLKAINKDIWPEVDADLGWSFILQHSLSTVTAIDSKEPVIAYYHPWTDIFLVTVWREKKDSFQLVDIEVFNGDTVRGRKISEVELVPYWVRGKGFVPLRIAKAVAESIRAAESRFDTSSGALFRDRVGDKTQYPSCLLMLYSYIRVQAMYKEEVEKGNKVFAATDARVSQFLEDAQRGDLKKCLKQAKETIPTVKDTLKAMPTIWFSLLDQVGFYNAGDMQFIFLSPVINATGCVSLMFDNSKGKAKLRRIDLIDYAGAYKMLANKTHKEPAL